MSKKKISGFISPLFTQKNENSKEIGSGVSCRLTDHKLMAKCIRNNMECAAICYAVAELMSLGSSRTAEICRLCAEICETIIGI
ncbi:MAG: hypothetical protein PHS71_04235 [Proteiniphilum sp.]|nr:hypothetical protein [Proteiniphilum sp.]